MSYLGQYSIFFYFKNSNLNKISKKSIILICIFILQYYLTNADEIVKEISQNKIQFKSIDFSIGKEYLYSQNNFKQIREISNCCDVNFDNNIGRALAISIGTKFEIAEIENISPIYLTIGLGYSSNKMTFRRFQPIFLGINDSLINGEFEHKVEFDFNFYNLNIAGEIQIYNDIYYSIGFNLARAGKFDFSQIEQITKPNDIGVFVNNTGNPDNDNKRTRNVVNTQFENKNLYFGIDNNLTYKLPSKFNKISTYFILGYKIITNQMLENVDWKMNKLSTSIILSYEIN